MALKNREAELDWNAEEDTRPQLLLIGIVGFQLAVVDCQPGAGVKKKPVAE